MEKMIQTLCEKPGAQITARRRKTLMLYLAFYGIITLGLIPAIAAAFLSISLLILMLIMLYKTAKEAENDDDAYTHSHAQHLIRTFWIGNFYLLISTFISILYFLMFVKLSTLTPCTHTLLNNLDVLAKTANIKDLLDIFMPCIEKFVFANKITLNISAFIAFFPVLLYLFIRFLWGWTHAVKNREVSTNKSNDKVRLRDV